MCFGREHFSNYRGPFQLGNQKENISFNMNWFFFLMALKCWVLPGPPLAPGGIPTRGAAPLINTSTHVLQIQCATSNFQIVYGPGHRMVVVVVLGW